MNCCSLERPFTHSNNLLEMSIHAEKYSISLSFIGLVIALEIMEFYFNNLRKC